MSELTKKINNFFRLATRQEVQEVKGKIYISEHLEQVFRMYYIEKKSISYIADITGYDVSKINRDLRLLREKISKII
jgi:DNA-directed RNA polymerase specialized sigma24 family protein